MSTDFPGVPPEPADWLARFPATAVIDRIRRDAAADVAENDYRGPAVSHHAGRWAVTR